jgi:hypothetical protein
VVVVLGVVVVVLLVGPVAPKATPPGARRAPRPRTVTAALTARAVAPPRRWRRGVREWGMACGTGIRDRGRL